MDQSSAGKGNHLGAKLLLIISDYVAVGIGLYIAYMVRLHFPWLPVSGDFHLQASYFLLWIPLLFVLVLAFNGTYVMGVPYWDKLKGISKSVIISAITIVFLMYAGKVTDEVSRLFLGLSIIFIGFFLVVGRGIAGKILIKTNAFDIPVLLIGAGETAKLVLPSFKKNPQLGYRFIGYVDDNPNAKLNLDIPYMGALDDIEAIIKKTKVETVLICMPGLESKKLVKLVTKLQILVRRVAFIPELFNLPVGNISARGLMEENTLVLRLDNNLARKTHRVTKRIFDLLLTVTGGLLILPFMLIIAAFIYFDSPGPVIYKQKRIGKNGKEFDFYKFRSMVMNADKVIDQYLEENPEAKKEWQRNFKLKHDPRVTRIGRFIRKTSIDELPQLWNVIKGDMSLVGPRPLLPNEVERYGAYIDDYGLVPPGLTGVWQVSGRSDTTFEERVQMDSWYIHNWTVWIDIVYLVKTFLVIAKSKGAY